MECEGGDIIEQNGGKVVLGMSSECSDKFFDDVHLKC